MAKRDYYEVLEVHRNASETEIKKAYRRTFGHSGYRSSTAFADPEHRLVVALATNGTPSDPDHLERMRRVTKSVYEELGLVGQAG